jgi:Cysteine-rich CPCC
MPGLRVPYPEGAYGSYVICDVCGWEDDQVQLANPACGGGANSECSSKLKPSSGEAALRRARPPGGGGACSSRGKCGRAAVALAPARRYRVRNRRRIRERAASRHPRPIAAAAAALPGSRTSERPAPQQDGRSTRAPCAARARVGWSEGEPPRRGTRRPSGFRAAAQRRDRRGGSSGASTARSLASRSFPRWALTVCLVTPATCKSSVAVSACPPISARSTSPDRKRANTA